MSVAAEPIESDERLVRDVLDCVVRLNSAIEKCTARRISIGVERTKAATFNGSYCVTEARRTVTIQPLANISCR